MATLDVSWVLGDANFASPFTLITRAETINRFGENVIEEKSESAVGVVQAATADVMNILPQGAYPTDYIKVWYTKGLRPNEHVILWCGRRYAVENVQEWLNYGEGYVCALCKLETVNG